MPKSKFVEQFQAIGYSMAKKAKTEVQEINKAKTQKIREINREFTKTLIINLKERTENFVKNYETQLNMQISENIKDLNLKMLSKKNSMFDEYLKSLRKKIQKQINDNYINYTEKIIENIKINSKIFKSAVYIQLNSRDKGLLGKIQSKIGSKKLILEPKPLESIGGYILSNRANTITISDTIEDTIQKNLNQLRIMFSKIFPEYSDRRKSATELMKERQISVTSSMPKELENYMLTHNIDFEK